MTRMEFERRATRIATQLMGTIFLFSVIAYHTGDESYFSRNDATFIHAVCRWTAASTSACIYAHILAGVFVLWLIADIYDVIRGRPKKP